MPNQVTVPINAVASTSAARLLRSVDRPLCLLTSPTSSGPPGEVVRPNCGTYLKSKMVSWPPSPTFLSCTVNL